MGNWDFNVKDVKMQIRASLREMGLGAEDTTSAANPSLIHRVPITYIRIKRKKVCLRLLHSPDSPYTVNFAILLCRSRQLASSVCSISSTVWETAR